MILQKGGDDPSAAFHHQGIDPQLAQSFHQTGKLHQSGTIDGTRQYPPAGIFQLRHSLRIRIGAASDQQRFGVVQDGSLIRQPQMGVEHNGLRRFTFNFAGCESRVVYQYGLDADQNGIVLGSKMVRHRQRFRATDGNLTATRGDAAIEALRVTERDGGSNGGNRGAIRHRIGEQGLKRLGHRDPHQGNG